MKRRRSSSLPSHSFAPDGGEASGMRGCAAVCRDGVPHRLNELTALFDQDMDAGRRESISRDASEATIRCPVPTYRPVLCPRVMRPPRTPNARPDPGVLLCAFSFGLLVTSPSSLLPLSAVAFYRSQSSTCRAFRRRMLQLPEMRQGVLSLFGESNQAFSLPIEATRLCRHLELWRVCGSTFRWGSHCGRVCRFQSCSNK
jgi:hypothetical protein